MSYLAFTPHPVRIGYKETSENLTTVEQLQSQTSSALKRDKWVDDVFKYNETDHTITKLYGNMRHYAVDRPFIRKGLNSTSGYCFNYTIKGGNTTTDPRFDAYNPVDLSDNIVPPPYLGLDFRPSVAMDIGTSLTCGYRTEYFSETHNPVPPSSVTTVTNFSRMIVFLITEAF